MNASLVIPALNEEDSLPHVLDAINKDLLLEVILVDGGSQDRTVAIARDFGALVINEPQPGYGRACAAGVANARGEIVIFMDADGADDPGQIPDLLVPITQAGADMVLGSRLAGSISPGAMPWHQKFGNWLSSGLIRLLYGLPITDLSPFRAVLRAKLLDLNMQEMTYGWPTEMITRAARQGWSIIEVPVNYHPRLGGKSKISGTLRGTILATYYILSTIIKYSFRDKKL
ncbi:MAG: glycosyltransferase family 2 protein [Anaerolineales bacterium]|nr:glycosyltransferase family 2 protein [Anaerolineales bacterium]